jgi:hypothetical protein
MLARYSVVAGGLLSVVLAGPAGWGDEPRVAIGGYDAVAYFTDAQPVPGRTEFEYAWHDARWQFASSVHRDLFVGNPEHYAPQYDGYCASGVSTKSGHKDTVDPQAWAIVDGKLYMTHSRQSLANWQRDVAERIKKGDENWPTVKEMPEPN